MRSAKSDPRRRLAPVACGLAGLLALGTLLPRPGGIESALWSGLFADVMWLRLNLAWERRDEPAVRESMRWTLAAAPGENYFRLNAARILAYDLPAWRAQGDPRAPAAVVRRWRSDAAGEASALLLAGRQDDPALWLEAANIALYAGGDRELAAQRYRRAAELPGAPWHAGRIHARLLQDMGRHREALDWLLAWSKCLPRQAPAAQAELVQARIAELEAVLRSRGEPL